MTRYGLKTYGTFVYGPSPSTISSVAPDSGPSIGGVDIIVEGVGFDPRQWDDLFNTGSLDLAKWTDISSGSGSITTGGPGLNLSTGTTASSIAGIESVALWADCQHEIRLRLPRISSNPPGDVVPIAFQLRVDASNYAVMYVVLDITGIYTLNCDVFRGGVSVGSYSQTISRGSLVFRILRWNSTVYFILNGSIVYFNSSFVNTAATSRVYASNSSQTYDAVSDIEWFYWRTFLTIDNQLIFAPTVVSDYRVRGLTPPSVNDKDVSASYAGLADVSLIANGKDTSTDAYEYYYVDRLRVMNIPQFNILLSVIDDDQLITKSTSSKGL